ncbi:MAG: hypothetical protein KKH52_04640 [Nanoarchaeota archaeon]|nr:hypothetical protein [Nanoarchaeota archaeon]
MADYGKMPLKTITLRYAGIFDFDGFYAAVIDWAKNYGYMWHEVDYKHKIPSPAGAEQEWRWQMTKEVNDYISYKIVFRPIIFDMKEMEIEVDGKKKCLTSGRIEITIDGTVLYDWQKTFMGKWLPKKLGKIYNEYIFKKELESIYYDQLYYRIWNLQAIMKKFLDMQTKKYAYKGYLGEN